jgi:acetyl esterase/lipase
VLDRAIVDPDQQMPLPSKAAEDYVQTIMQWAGDTSATGVVAHRDIAYGEHRLHRYNVFAPPGATNAPVLVFWHGGGWINGYRDYVSFMAPPVVQRGFVLVAPSYRLAPAHPLPAAFDDSLALLAHLEKHVARYGGAADRLYLSGHSSGGHLAALAALRVADRLQAGIGAHTVRGCLPVSGIMDLHHPAPAPGSLEERVYTMVLRNADDDALMSPVCWTAGNRLPFVLSYGERDSERVIRSNRRLLALLKRQDADVDAVVESGTDHFQTHTMLRDAAHPWYQRLARLVERTQP